MTKKITQKCSSSVAIAETQIKTTLIVVYMFVTAKIKETMSLKKNKEVYTEEFR